MLYIVAFFHRHIHFSHTLSFSLYPTPPDLWTFKPGNFPKYLILRVFPYLCHFFKRSILFLYNDNQTEYYYSVSNIKQFKQYTKRVLQFSCYATDYLSRFQLYEIYSFFFFNRILFNSISFTILKEQFSYIQLQYRTLHSQKNMLPMVSY